MSPRARIIRKVVNPPIIKGFKPYGNVDETHENKQISLQFEEYEALRLCDYEMYNHQQAAKLMGISRPTFTRIYSSVRKKIAKAFAEGLQMSIEGGKVYFDSDWYHCNSCKCYFNNPFKEEETTECPLCRSKNLSGFDIETESIIDETTTHSESQCVCIGCGHTLPHQHRLPCSRMICPACSGRMRRK